MLVVVVRISVWLLYLFMLHQLLQMLSALEFIQMTWQLWQLWSLYPTKIFIICVLIMCTTHEFQIEIVVVGVE
jgi:hypothetical protein